MKYIKLNSQFIQNIYKNIIIYNLNILIYFKSLY